MATEASIYFDFQKALGEAGRIEDMADRLKRLSEKDFEGTLQSLSVNWKGENASAYLVKGERLQDKINGTGNDLRAVAADIRRIAKQIYDAEMAALEIARRREYEERQRNQSNPGTV